MRGIVFRDDFGWANAPRFGGSTGSTTSSSNTSPWSGQVPFLAGNTNTVGAPDPNAPTTPGYPGGQAIGQGNFGGLLNSAQALYEDTAAWPQYYPNATYAPLNTQQNSAISQLEGIGAGGGDSGLNAANSYDAATLSPSYTGLTMGPFSSAEGYLNNTINGSGVNTANPTYSAGLNYLNNQIAGQGVSQTQGAYNAGQNYLTGMINGDTLNPFNSPGFSNVVQGTLASVLPATSASFINGGRADSGLAQAAQTQAATQAIGQLANQNYVQEQGLQQGAEGIASQNQAMQLGLQQAAGNAGLSNYQTQENLQQGAAGLASNNLLTQQGNQVKTAAVAPTVDQAQTQDAMMGLNAAGMTQQDAQNQINAQIQKWNYNQTLPYNMLGMYQGYTGGNYGGASNVTTPYYTNPAAGYLGGALSGAAIGSSFGPIGAGVGAAGGLLASLLSH